MLRRTFSWIVAGAFGAVIVGIGESLAVESTSWAVIAASIGLVLPLGVIAGAGLSAAAALAPKSLSRRRTFELLAARRQPRDAGRLLAVGLSWLVILPLLYRIVFFFLTAFHHQGLAALALAVTVATFGGVAALASGALGRLAGRAFANLDNKLPFLGQPRLALAVVAAAWLVALIPPLIKGPDAAGVFGFVGFLRKDGLGAGPLIALGAMIVVTIASQMGLTRLRRPALIWTSVLALVLGLAGPMVAGASVAADTEAVDVLDAGPGVVSLIMREGRRLSDGDGDGHGSWLGGRDCDDSRPDIHPGARDEPGNGVDEDCSGEDLDLAALREKAGQPDPTIEQPPPSRPSFPPDLSVVLITVDTWRWDAAGFMSYERDVTPSIDRVAARGVVYERAYALGSYTGQAVPPMLTGKYASELKRNDRHEVRVSKDELFAAEEICGGEVRCAAFLTHFLFKPHYGWNQGFDEWKVVGAEPSGPGHIDSKYNSHIVANQAIKWLGNEENTSGRFWLWVHFMDPHKEYLAHPGVEKFGDDRRGRYDHELKYTDRHVGRLLDALAALEAAARTVIIITADHGEAFNEHGRWCHGRELWEEIIRVPLVVAGPGIPTKRITRQTSHIELFATLLDLFDRPVPEGIHGRSLLADWVEENELPPRPVIADQPKNTYYETRRVFIADGWKLHHLPDTGSYRLFEITADYERGESLVESRPEDFERVKAAYEIFLATEFKPLDPVPIRAMK